MQRPFRPMPSEFRGTLFSDAANLQFGPSCPLPSVQEGRALLVNELQINYSQPVNRLYALDSSRVYFVAGRTIGIACLKRVLGSPGGMQAFFAAISPNRAISSNVVEFAGLIKAKASLNCYCAEGCDLKSVGFIAVAGGIAVSESTAFDFSKS